MREEAVKALQDLVHDDGDLVVDEVLDAARPEDSPLHRYFTWDDTVAAARYREEQARGLIGRYKIEITVRGPRDAGEFRVLTRGYEAASRTGAGRPPGTYRAVGQLTDKERAVLLQTMQRDINALRRRYGHLREFWERISELSAQAETEAAASG